MHRALATMDAACETTPLISLLQPSSTLLEPPARPLSVPIRARLEDLQRPEKMNLVTQVDLEEVQDIAALYNAFSPC